MAQDADGVDRAQHAKQSERRAQIKMYWIPTFYTSLLLDSSHTLREPQDRPCCLSEKTAQILGTSGRREENSVRGATQKRVLYEGEKSTGEAN